MHTFGSTLALVAVSITLNEVKGGSPLKVCVKFMLVSVTLSSTVWEVGSPSSLLIAMEYVMTSLKGGGLQPTVMLVAVAFAIIGLSKQDAEYVGTKGGRWEVSRLVAQVCMAIARLWRSG